MAHSSAGIDTVGLTSTVTSLGSAVATQVIPGVQLWLWYVGIAAGVLACIAWTIRIVRDLREMHRDE